MAGRVHSLSACRVFGGAMGIRWDAVVQKDNLWSERARRSTLAPEAGPNHPVRVQVWMFGSLNDGRMENPVAVQLHGPFTVGNVIAEIGSVCGRAFLDRVSDSAGNLFRNCRVFVNGQAVDAPTTPIHTDGPDAAVEMILLTAAEGG